MNGVENNYKTFQGQELHEDLGLNVHEFKYRFYDGAIGRFWSIDPLADGYTYQSPYNFAENSVVANFELEGLEAKLAIHGEGAIGTTAYSQSDINAFHARASSLEKNHGYSAEGVSNGQALLSSLKTATAEEGSVQSAVIFAHGSGAGIYLDPSDGFYNSSLDSNGTNSASVADLKSAINDGSISFTSDATLVFGSCNACYQGMSSPLAETITNETGVTTIGATGYVEPEIVNGKETGKLTTTGTFIKSEKQFTVSFTDSDGKVVHTKTLGSQNLAESYAKGFNFDNAYSQSITSKVVQTDLGSTIDPNKL